MNYLLGYLLMFGIFIFDILGVGIGVIVISVVILLAIFFTSVRIGADLFSKVYFIII
jgi:hypothetical protein